MHFSSLPGPCGIGDIGDAANRFLPLLSRMGLNVWQFLPVGPTGYAESPYQLLSDQAGHEILIGLEPLVREGLLREDELSPLRAIPQAPVDFGQIVPLKRALLATAAHRFAAAGQTRHADYEGFLHACGARWLNDYTLFRLLKDLHDGAAWNAWALPFARREQRALKKLTDRHRAELEVHSILQFFFHRQWRYLQQAARDRNIRLFGDLPIYLSLDSADAWISQSLLQLDERGRPSRLAGVPPDYFSQTGQLWGNPLYDWPRHAEQDYQWWIQRIRSAIERYDLVRIDHFRGFESYWSVAPEAQDASSGCWRPGPRDALFKALETALDDLPLVAENLGEITPEVEALRKRHDIPGMHVLQFAVDDPKFDIDDIEPESVCYTATHDNDTTAGWFRGGPQDERPAAEVRASRANAIRHTGGQAGSIHLDMIRLAFSSPARWAVAPLQDFMGLGSAARMNRPGTVAGNWLWRLQEGELTERHIETATELVSFRSRN